MPIGEGAITLRDGRNLSYAEFGDPNGAPAFFFHGFPNSRLGAAFAEDEMVRRRVRLIAFDRPGFGRSDFQPGRRILDWVDDVTQAADALGIDRFAVIGVSGGGPYAAACAARIPERITSVGLISALGPMTEPEARKGIRLRDRISFALARRLPLLLMITMWFVSFFVRRLPDRAIRQALRSLPPADRQILLRPEVKASVIADLQESFRQSSRAAAHEAKLYLNHWGFSPAEITIEVHLWHGDADTTVPVSMGHYLAGAIPNCNSTFYPNEGHLLVVDRFDEMGDALFRRAA